MRWGGLELDVWGIYFLFSLSFFLFSFYFSGLSGIILGSVGISWWLCSLSHCLDQVFLVNVSGGGSLVVGPTPPSRLLDN